MSTDASDEAFWQRQELRREKKLGQPCCTQSGMSWEMIDMPGNFAVVIHGEFDCVNCFHHHIGRSTTNFYSTRLTEQQLITGETGPPLRRLLTLLAAERHPDAVIVLGTCPVEVIGDRFEVVVDEVAAETGVPMLALHTSGLKLSSQRDMLDWLFTALSQLPAAPAQDRGWLRDAANLALDVLFDAVDPTTDTLERWRNGFTDLARREPSVGRLNLVGLPDTHGRTPEPVQVLARAGIGIHGVYPFGASIGQWRAIRHADRSAVVDPDMFPRFVEQLRAYGQDILPMQLPIGLAPSVDFYRAIAASYGRERALEQALAPTVAPLRQRVDALRSAIGGRRLAIAIRMLNTFQTDQLAYEGLGDLAAFQELGFDIELLVQGPPEEATRQAFAERLASLGHDLRFRIFPGPWILSEFLADGGYALACVPDSSRDAAHRAGVPMLSARSLAPYLEGVPGNLDRIARALGLPAGGAA